MNKTSGKSLRAEKGIDAGIVNWKEKIKLLIL